MTLDPSKDPNSLFRAKLGGGQAALRILLSQKPTVAPNAGNQASDAQADNQSRVRSYRRTPDELVPKKKGFVNFYDLGQVASGESWVDLDFWVRWNDIGNALANPHTVGHATFFEEDWHTLADLIMTVPKADWKTTYRKLEYTTAELMGTDIIKDDLSIKYSLGRVHSRKDGNGVLITGDNWVSGKGLKLASPMPYFQALDFGLFPFMGTPKMGDLYGDCEFITASYDPMAASVGSFSLKQGDNVYLMPRIVSLYATRFDESTTNAWGTRNYTMVCPYRALSREFWLNRSNGSDFLPNIFSYCSTALTLDATNSADLLAYMNGLTGTRWFRTTWPSSTPTVVELLSDPGGWELAWIEQNRADVANSRIDVPIVADPESNATVTVAAPGISEGILTGVVERGSNYFYFWRVAGGPNWIDNGGPVHHITLTP